MRINQFVAQASGLSRRAADTAIQQGRVTINGQPAQLGDEVSEKDSITLDEENLRPPKHLIIMLNKPAGFVTSRQGQGSKTIYDLLPDEYSHLKPVGRLDKDSSGLILLTNDGELANQLTHPRYSKAKIYEIELDKPLSSQDERQIQQGIRLEDGMSKLQLKRLPNGWQITMTEGRNRQIRRTFAALGYTVTSLHRTQSGQYALEDLPPGLARKLRF